MRWPCALVRLHDSRVLTPLIDIIGQGDPSPVKRRQKRRAALARAPVIPLINMLRDEVNAGALAASEALVHIGPCAEQMSSPIVLNGPASIRKLAAETLEKIGVPNHPKVQVWIAILHNNLDLGFPTGNFGGVPGGCHARDPDPHVRCAAVELLGESRDIRTIIPLCALT